MSILLDIPHDTTTPTRNKILWRTMYAARVLRVLVNLENDFLKFYQILWNPYNDFTKSQNSILSKASLKNREFIKTWEATISIVRSTRSSEHIVQLVHSLLVPDTTRVVLYCYKYLVPVLRIEFSNVREPGTSTWYLPLSNYNYLPKTKNNTFLVSRKSVL